MVNYKMNKGVITVLILSMLFIGWVPLILVVGLLVLTNNAEESKDLLIKTIALAVGCLLFTIGWDIIVSLINLLEQSINSLFSLFYVFEWDITKPEFLYDIFEKIIPIIVPLISDVVVVLVLLAKFTFVFSTITGKNKGPKPFKKLEKLINKVANFIFNVNSTNNQQNVQPVNQNIQATQAQNINNNIQ